MEATKGTPLIYLHRTEYRQEALIHFFSTVYLCETSTLLQTLDAKAGCVLQMPLETS